MGFQDEMTEAFDEALVVLTGEAADGSGSFRFPVLRNGTDKALAANYDCIPSPSPDNIDLVTGGFRAEYQFSMAARREDFTTLPMSGDLFLKGGRVSRVLFVDNSEVSPLVVFHCGTPDK